MPRAAVVVRSVAVLFAVGCREKPAVDWTVVADSQLAAPARAAQYARAEQARAELAQSLLQRLNATLEAGGPASAVSVCREIAPELARTVGDKHGVRIGRTSFRLRNPASVPPPWAAAAVAGRTKEARVLGGPHGQLGVLTPIVVAEPCLKCHGAPEAIDPAVRSALAAAYPQDRATGFAAGDLRGYFWVEVEAAH